MISSASTLLLATLVFNAATVFGAPIRIVGTVSEPVARAEMSAPVQPVVARAAIVDVQDDNRRLARLGHITRRKARLVSERDEPLPEAVVAREPEPVVPVVAPVVESRERRYPRRVYHDFFVKREPATSIKETTKVVEKVTTLDTPADVAAFIANKDAFASPSASGVTVSTITSTSQTTTIAASDAVPTPAPTADPSASASSSADSASASATSTASDSASTSTAAGGEPTPTASGDPASATGDATATAGGDPTEPTPTASATSSAASGAPTDAPADGSGDSKPADGSDGSGDSKPADGTDGSGDPKPADGTDGSGDPKPADGTTPSDPSAGPAAPAARDDAGDMTEARRGIYIKASTEPIVRRLASSGASWASSVRRQLNTH
ncbi:hypothetical protein M413DRAFT_447319 [Hebeloma cylindrosporum]|uniref:Uncharacterized protein n=1 Tax=Hebeloma cylindrosporum TaxID=76867 RepID=A0A0C2YED9_HEBCY|nr:hypothetical protein M413DRAFT_447319 [Hebeloma cylindrosporum h7]